MNGLLSRPAREAVLTTWAGRPWASSSGRKARMPLITPPRLTARARCHCESLSSQQLPVCITPALLNSRSTVPKRCRAASRRCSSCVASATSVTWVSTCTPCSLSCAARRSRDSPSRSARTRCSLSVMARSARPRPMPLAAPVITATRYGCSFMAVRSSLVCQIPAVISGGRGHRYVRAD
ncbi:hypothetical protein D3C84_526390 [compost metagenome]